MTTRTVLEAMISHSDNTAADMMLLSLDADQVRALIASLGLRQSEIPDSIRQFFAYVAGDPSWQSVSGSQLLNLATLDPYPHRRILNDTSSFASSPDDLVSFFVRALQGELFQFPETLSVFRAILAKGEVNSAIAPLGVTAFLKSGSVVVTPENAQAFAGGLYVADRWVYCALLWNWLDEEWAPLPDVQHQVLDVLRAILGLVRDRLGT